MFKQQPLHHPLTPVYLQQLASSTNFSIFWSTENQQFASEMEGHSQECDPCREHAESLVEQEKPLQEELQVQAASQEHLDTGASF